MTNLSLAVNPNPNPSPWHFANPNSCCSVAGNNDQLSADRPEASAFCKPARLPEVGGRS